MAGCRPWPNRRAATYDRGKHTRREVGLDSGLVDALVKSRRFFTKGDVSDDLRSLHKKGGRDADTFYRDRWSHDKVVRSTHGVNCTGSCSWKVYVKDGIITWETQQTDYPSVGPDKPEYEPRGCPRGAAFSWYTYSPTRVRYPYVRGVLLQMYREAKSQHGDPVLAWAHVVDNAQRAQGLQVRPRQGRHGPRLLGGGHRDGGRGVRPHDQEVGPRPGRRVLADPGDVDGLARLRRPVHLDDRRLDAVVLRLVRRPAGRLAAGVRRPDRRARVRRLVGRRLPGDVGLQRPGDPHAGRALDDRGALPRPEGRRGLTRLRRQREVRRRLAGDRSGHRRGARDGDGPRRAQGVLRRPADAVLRRLHQEVHRPALPGRAGPGSRTGSAGDSQRRLPAGQDAHRRRPPRARGRRERPLQDRADGRPHPAAGRPQRLAGSPLRRQRRRQLEPRPRRGRPGPVAARGQQRVGPGGAAPLRQPRRHARLAAPRRPGPAGRRPSGHHRVRPDARAVRRRPRRPAGGVADRLRRRLRAVHPGVAGDDHRCPGPGGGPDRPGVRAERRGVPGPLDDPDGRGHQPLVPLRHDLPRLPDPDHPDRLPGRQRRRVGALRRPGEVPADHRLGAARLRPGLEASSAADDPHRLLVPAHQPVPVRRVPRRRGLGQDRHRQARRHEHRRRDREERADGLDAVLPDVQPQPARRGRRGGRGGPSGRRPRGRPAEVRRR